MTINNDGVPGEKVSSLLWLSKKPSCATLALLKKWQKAWCSNLERNGYWYAQIHSARTPGMTMMDLMQIAPLFEVSL